MTCSIFDLTAFNCPLTSTVLFIASRSINTWTSQRTTRMSPSGFMLREKDVRSFPGHKIVAHFSVNRPLTNNKQARRPLSAPHTYFFLVSQDYHHKTQACFLASRKANQGFNPESTQGSTGLFEKGRPS